MKVIFLLELGIHLINVQGFYELFGSNIKANGTDLTKFAMIPVERKLKNFGGYSTMVIKIVLFLYFIK